jgi:hypothetical protein
VKCSELIPRTSLLEDVLEHAMGRLAVLAVVAEQPLASGEARLVPVAQAQGAEPQLVRRLGQGMGLGVGYHLSLFSTSRRKT